MKSSSLIIGALSLFLGFKTFAKEYPYFIDQDGYGYLTTTNGERIVDPAYIEKAKRALDSRPAAQDPEGNWGAVVDGLQVSIRLDKKTYDTNEPIVATIIMRNVSENERVFDISRGLPCYITIIDPQGRKLERSDWYPKNTFQGSVQRLVKQVVHKDVYPGMQVKLQLDLRKFFNLTNSGQYTVSTKMAMYKSDLKSAMEDVSSGSTSIAITNSATAATNSPPPKPGK